MSALANLSERDRRALMLLVPAVGLILLIRFLLPLWDNVSDSSGQIAVLEKTLMKYRRASESVPKHETSAASLAAALADSEKGLLPGATPSLQSAELQQLVRDIATSAGITLRSVDFAQPKNLSEDYVVHGVNTQFVAGIDQVVALLNALQSAPRILAVDQIRLTAVNTPASASAASKKQVAAYISISGVAAAPAANPSTQTPANTGGK